MLERIKTMYNPTPGMAPDKIGPTIGQNSKWRYVFGTWLTASVGKISLPSTTLLFYDLGGQRDIRSIWEKYYDECHAVVFVLDATDQARLSETWEVFGKLLKCETLTIGWKRLQMRFWIPLDYWIYLCFYLPTSKIVRRVYLWLRSENHLMPGREWERTVTKMATNMILRSPGKGRRLWKKPMSRARRMLLGQKVGAGTMEGQRRREWQALMSWAFPL